VIFFFLFTCRHNVRPNQTQHLGLKGLFNQKKKLSHNLLCLHVILGVYDFLHCSILCICQYVMRRVRGHSLARTRLAYGIYRKPVIIVNNNVKNMDIFLIKTHGSPPLLTPIRAVWFTIIMCFFELQNLRLYSLPL